jgi:hypothetical protein
LSTARPKRIWRCTSAGRRIPRRPATPAATAGRERRQHGRERLAEQARDLAQREHAVAGAVEGAGQLVVDGVLEAPDDVVLVDELQARVEAEDPRYRGQPEQPAPRRAQVGAEPVDEPQPRDRDAGLALGEVADRRVGLDDVALERRARRLAARHLLGEEAGSSCSQP